MREQYKDDAVDPLGWVVVCDRCGIRQEFTQPRKGDAVEAAIKVGWMFQTVNHVTTELCKPCRTCRE